MVLGVAVVHADHEVALQDHRRHEQGGINAAATAGTLAAIERRGDAVREQGGAHEVGDGRAFGDGAAIAHAPVHGHKATERLHDLVHAGQPRIRPLLPEGADVPDDNAGVALREAVVVEAELGGEAGAEVGEDDVGPGKEGVEDGGGLVVAEGEGEGVGAAVAGEEVAGDIAPAVAGIAGGLALVGLDLDDVGAAIGKELGAVGNGHELAEFQHGDAGEGLLVAHDSSCRGRLK